MVFKQITYHLSRILFILSAAVCLSGCGKKPPLPPHIPSPHAEQQAQLNGRVVRYGTNPEGNIDRLVLGREPGNQETEIHFPPHLAKPILDIAKVNASVTLRISHGHRGDELITVSSEDGRMAFDAGKILPPKPSPGKEIRLKGAVSGMIRNRENTVTGFVIGKRTVMLNPEEGRILDPLLPKAGQVEVIALERSAEDGTINTLRFPPVKATEIKIDSIIYKIR